MSILNVDKIQPIGSGTTVTVNATDTILTNAQAGVITATKFSGPYEGLSVVTDDWITHQGDTNTRMGFPAADTFKVETAGNQRLHITSAGKVGVGIDPTARLHVNGLSSDTAIILARSADSNGNSVINILSEGTTGSSRILFSDTAAATGDAWISYSHNDRAITFTTAGTSNERLRITSAGLVGINQNPTTAQLVIKNSNDSSLNSIDIINDNGNVSTSISQDSSGAGSFLQKNNSGTIKTFIKSYGDSYFTGGGVIIGNTAPVFSSPTPSLTIEKSDNATGPLFQMYNAASAQAGATCEIRVHQNYRDANRIIFGRENNNNWQAGASGTASYMGFWTNSAGTIAERMRISSQGYVNQHYQPCFQAHSNGASSVDIPSNTGSDYIFTTESFDNSSSYNTSNGRFTAPVAGKYVFGIQLYAGFSITGVRVLHAKFSKNGGDDYATDIMGGTNNSGGTSWHPTAAGTVMYELAANDYVTWNIGSFAGSGSGHATIYGAKGTRFWGYLVA